MSPINQPNTAVPLNLPFQVNPQGNTALVHSTSNCQVFVSLWDEHNGELPTLGKFRFLNAWASRCFSSEDGGNYRTANTEPLLFFARIDQSTWLTECINRRLTRYPDWLKWDKRIYHHYVVRGHDNYVEIVAEDVEILSATEAENELFYDLCS